MPTARTTLLRLLGIDVRFQDYATEVLTRPGIASHDRVILLRNYLGLPKNRKGRKPKTAEYKARRVSDYNRERYHRLKTEGRCTTCTQPNPNAPRSRCLDCAPARRHKKNEKKG
jgi:uncharacterized protein with PIN domain